MSSLKSRWKRKGTGEIIHPETEIDQLKNGDNALAGLISLLLKSATTADARNAISAAAASHTHSSGDIQNFASNVITAIGEETLEALGVRYSITTNGYICFGQLFGGLILQWTEGTYNRTISNNDYSYYQVQLPISFSKGRLVRVGGYTAFRSTSLGTANVSLEFTPDYGSCVCVRRTAYDLEIIGEITGLWLGY